MIFCPIFQARFQRWTIFPLHSSEPRITLCLDEACNDMNHLWLRHLEQLVTHRPETSLAKGLRTYHLTSKMKVVLAFILAHSLW